MNGRNARQIQRVNRKPPSWGIRLQIIDIIYIYQLKT